MDKVNAFSSSGECNSSVIPEYPIEIIPLADTLTGFSGSSGFHSIYLWMDMWEQPLTKMDSVMPRLFSQMLGGFESPVPHSS